MFRVHKTNRLYAIQAHYTGFVAMYFNNLKTKKKIEQSALLVTCLAASSSVQQCPRYWMSLQNILIGFLKGWKSVEPFGI